MTTGSNHLIDDKSREIISGSQVFMGLKPEILAGILENTHEKDLKIGQLIIQEGESLTGLYIIIEGKASIENNFGAELFTRRAGDTLGEMTMIDSGKRTVSVRAKTDVKIAEINLDYMLSLFDEDPKTLATVAINIARILNERLREGL